jgi:TatD DNase family protein
MHFIDSHAHLADPAFDADREAVISRARDAGAIAVICIGESIAAADRAFEIAKSHPRFAYHTAGIHPHDAHLFDAARDIEAIRSHVAQGAVAIGECGLDYHYDHSPRSAQIEAFEAQIALAAELSKPVIVHSREADSDMTAMIENACQAGVLGVLHCFTGPLIVAEKALSVGWYVSFSGIITFKKWDDLALLRAVPDERLLVETDSPYLAPVPFRGKRNEPGYVARTIERLAGVRGIAAESLANVTADNTRRLFTLAMPHPRS